MYNFDEELIKKYIPKDKWNEANEKLIAGYPIQYIIGNVEFYGNIIKVNESVLIPRFETEYLVDDVIKLIKDYQLINPNIIDIGTGSGCIAIALKKNLECKIDALDISKEALIVAKDNAQDNQVDISFICEDIKNFNTDKRYDVIISNPPYVAKSIKVDTKTKYEPQNAIFASDDGLYFYKIILEKSKNILNKKSIIAFEIGHNQGEVIKDIAQKYYPNSKIILKNDLNGFNRYIYIIND